MRTVIALLVVGQAAIAAAQVSGPGAGPTSPSTDGPPTIAADGTAAAAGSGSPPPSLDDWDSQIADFDKLRTPDSPAFVVLGIAPTEIQRPTTPRALTVALGEFVQGTGVAIPQNFALEVSPYWLFSHPDLTLHEYAKRGFSNFARSITFSIGTKQTTRTTMDPSGATTDHTDSDLGLGLRATLYQSPFAGNLAPCEQILANLSETTKLSKDEREQIENKHGKGTPNYDAAAAMDEIAQVVQTRASAAADQIVKDAKCFASAAYTRGFSVDLAGAIGVHVRDSEVSLSNSRLDVGAAWISGSWDTANFSSILLGRFMGRTTMADTQYIADAGVRLIYKRQDYAVSAEGLMRRRLSGPGDDWTNKVDIAAEYQIKSGTWFTVTFGKDFVFTPGNAGGLFSLANLAWSIGPPTISK